MNRPEPKYVSSNGPVNRRTALQGQRREPPPVANPAVQQRLTAAKAKARLGQPLAAQVKPSTGTQQAGASRAVAGLGLVVATGGGLFAWLESSLLGGLMALGLGGASLGWAWMNGRSAPAQEPQAPLIDGAHLGALDQALEALAPQLPEPALALLIDIKQHIAHLASQSRVADDLFTMEDVLYVNECVRRYLPDTLQAYVEVPVDQRAVSATPAGSQNANELLVTQLTLLRDALAQRKAKLAARATEALASQQRFLQAKSKS